MNMRVIFLFKLGSIGYDVISMISTSKIRNRRATVKNCSENGVVGGFMFLSPHSNCVQGFFLGVLDFFVFCMIVTRRRVRIREVLQMMEIFIIFLSF